MELRPGLSGVQAETVSTSRFPFLPQSVHNRLCPLFSRYACSEAVVTRVLSYISSLIMQRASSSLPSVDLPLCRKLGTWRRANAYLPYRDTVVSEGANFDFNNLIRLRVLH